MAADVSGDAPPPPSSAAAYEKALPSCPPVPELPPDPSSLSSGPAGPPARPSRLRSGSSCRRAAKDSAAEAAGGSPAGAAGLDCDMLCLPRGVCQGFLLSEVYAWEVGEESV